MSATKCDVCWGSGFYKGWGAPCSRGCLPPGEEQKPATPEERRSLPEWMEDLPELKDGYTKTPPKDWWPRGAFANVPAGKFDDGPRNLGKGTIYYDDEEQGTCDEFWVTPDPDTCDKTLADCRRHCNEVRFGLPHIEKLQDAKCPFVFRDSNCGLTDRTQSKREALSEFETGAGKFLARFLIMHAIQRAMDSMFYDD